VIIVKKNLNKGFVLAETLVVTTFVAGVLIFLFIQFTSLSKNYEQSYKYNTVEGLYALRNIRDYILDDNNTLLSITEKIDGSNYTGKEYLEITECSDFSEKEYCLKLFELYNINRIYVSLNKFNKTVFKEFDEEFKTFINLIKSDGSEKYRLIVEFNDSTFATIRFGENDE